MVGLPQLAWIKEEIHCIADGLDHLRHQPAHRQRVEFAGVDDLTFGPLRRRCLSGEGLVTLATLGLGQIGKLRYLGEGGFGRAAHSKLHDIFGRLCFVERTLVLTGDSRLVEIETIRVGWVAAAELEEGEVLRGHDGPLTVTQIGRIEGTRPVYNFSVEADHVYYAGSVEALTHNAYFLKKNLAIAGVWGMKGADQAAHIVPKTGFKRSADVVDAIEDSRAILKGNKIDIDSHWNGFRAGYGYLGTHTDKYLLELGDRLLTASAGGRVAVLRELQKLRYDILNGKFLP